MTIIGCYENKISEPKVLSADALKALVTSAANKDKKANDSLFNLIDFEMADNIPYKFIKVDSFYLDSIKYFSVLIEHLNPLYNRLAIYDTAANCYLIDKSLNGRLSSEVVEIINLKLFKVIESFIYKDTLSVVRLSLYRKIDDYINLVYRSFAELKTLKNTFNQTINFISHDTIKTQIHVPKKYSLDSKEDVFVFNYADKLYHSNQSIFDSLVYKEIANFTLEVQKPKKYY